MGISQSYISRLEKRILKKLQRGDAAGWSERAGYEPPAQESGNLQVVRGKGLDVEPLRGAERCRRRCRRLWEARGDHGDPDLVLQRLVDDGAEDDVRLRGRPLRR